MNDTYSRRGAHRTHTVVLGGAHTARRRGLTALERAALVAIVALLLLGTMWASPRPAAQVKTERVLAAPGDTLWALATSHPAAGLTTEQNAELIARLNGLREGAVVAGRAIAVPVKDDGSAVAMR